MKKNIREIPKLSVAYTVCKLPVTSTLDRVEGWRSEETLPGKGSLAAYQRKFSSPHSQAFFTSVSQSLCGRPESDSVSSISIQCVRVSLKEREVHRPEESFFRYQQGRGRAFSTLYLSGCQTQLFTEESGRTLVSTSGAVPLP